MLDAFIIEQIRRREGDRKGEHDRRPALELPLPPHHPTGSQRPGLPGVGRDEDGELPDRGIVRDIDNGIDRGVVIIDFSPQSE